MDESRSGSRYVLRRSLFGFAETFWDDRGAFATGKGPLMDESRSGSRRVVRRSLFGFAEKG
jgi:hypothetical protein